MEAYLDFVTAAMLTTLAVGLAILVVVGGVILYKIIKDEY